MMRNRMRNRYTDNKIFRGRRRFLKAGAGIAVSLVLSAVVTCMPIASHVAYAGEGDVFGQIDPFTGKLITTEEEETGTVEEVTEKTWISESCYYDPGRGMYGYYAGLSDVYASVANGMIVRERVNIQIPGDMDAILYNYAYPSVFTGGEVTEPGEYTLEVTSDGVTRQLFSFTITPLYTNSILNYNMPEGFRILSAERDGKIINRSRSFVDMSEEGEYDITYECARTGAEYTLHLVVDTTAPTLEILGIDEFGKARGPVDITGKSEQDTLYIERDGEAQNMILTSTLTQSGKYVVKVTDPAGNSRSYPFTIMIYLDRNGIIFALLLVLVIIALGAFIYYKRNNLKVR